jgi:MFS family permease
MVDAEHIALTLAGDGVLLVDRGGRVTRLPTWPVPRAGDVGAGDSFTAAMALARFAGDALRASFRERAVLRTSALVAALAMAMLLLSGERWAAFAGLAAVGAGLAPVAPILFNAATRVPGVSRAAAIASVTTIGYSGLLIGPPIIGSVASQASLAIALWLVVVAAAIVACGAGFVPEQRVPGGERPSLSPPEARSR